MSSRDLFDDLVPQHSGISSDLYDRYTTIVARRLDEESWGTEYPVAVVLLVGHLLDLRDRAQQGSASTSKAGGQAGGLVAWSEGDQSVDYSDPSDIARTVRDKILASTVSGQQYLSLRQQTISGPFSPHE